MSKERSTNPVPQQFKCAFCQQTFPKNSRLISHIFTHIQERMKTQEYVPDANVDSEKTGKSQESKLQDDIQADSENIDDLSTDTFLSCESQKSEKKLKVTISEQSNCRIKDGKKLEIAFLSDGRRGDSKRVHFECDENDYTIAIESDKNESEPIEIYFGRESGSPLRPATDTKLDVIDEDSKITDNKIRSSLLRIKINKSETKSQDDVMSLPDPSENVLEEKQTASQILASFGSYDSYDHGISTKSFRCEVCGARFNSKTDLTTHEQTHVESSWRCERTNVCEDCDEAFETRSQLFSHWKSCEFLGCKFCEDKSRLFWDHIREKSSGVDTTKTWRDTTKSTSQVVDIYNVPKRTHVFDECDKGKALVNRSTNTLECPDCHELLNEECHLSGHNLTEDYNKYFDCFECYGTSRERRNK